ncbi:hypothetical protein D3C80_1706000 [compost metagenome]
MAAQQRHEMPNAMNDAEDVDAENPFPIGFRKRLERAAHVNAGIVENQMHFAELCLELGGRGAHVGVARNVENTRVYAPPGRGELRAQGL